MRSALACAIAIAMTGLFSAACDDSSSAVKEPAPNVNPTADSGPGTPGGSDGGPLGGDGGPKDCFDDPKTHFEIINACTTATRITKNPTLTKLLPDGGLPPLD